MMNPDLSYHTNPDNTQDRTDFYPVGTEVEAYYNYSSKTNHIQGTVIGFAPKNTLAVLPPEIPDKQIHFKAKNTKMDRIIIAVKRYSEKLHDYTGTVDYYAINPRRVKPISPNTPPIHNIDTPATALKEEGDTDVE